MNKTVAIIEARMNSSRLPGKVLLKLGKFNIIDILIKRVKKSKFIDEVIVQQLKVKKMIF